MSTQTKTKAATVLSDGHTISIRSQHGIGGTHLHEVSSRTRKTATFLRLDNQLFLVTDTDLVRLDNPAYSAAWDVRTATASALAFCVDSAEAVIAHAAEQGVDVADCY